MSMGYALARAELIHTLTAYQGITTADGAIGGTTIIDAALIGMNDFITEKSILIMSGPAAYEDKGASAFNPITGQITLQSGFSAQITAGTLYRILNISSVEIDVATINTKIGTNVDAPGTTTLFAWLANLLTLGGQGLVYHGEVTAVDLATQFRVAGLAGLGDAYFANTYRVYVVRDAGGLGAAPQGEMQPCTAFTSVGGIFTHPAYTAGLAVGDEVLLIHTRIAEILDILGDIGNASGSVLGSIYAILGNPAQSFLTMIGYEGATALANKLTAARAALLDQITALRMAELDAANIPADINTLITRLTAQRALNLDWLDLTTFTQETVGATDVNGTTWKDLLDRSTITQPTKICGFMVTVAGAWAGNAKIRITDGAGNKIFPFQDEYIEATDFNSAAQVVFNFPVDVPVADGYKFQFRSTNAADGVGETLALNNLDVIEVG